MVVSDRTVYSVLEFPFHGQTESVYQLHYLSQGYSGLLLGCHSLQTLAHYEHFRGCNVTEKSKQLV